MLSRSFEQFPTWMTQTRISTCWPQDFYICLACRLSNAFAPKRSTKDKDGQRMTKNDKEWQRDIAGSVSNLLQLWSALPWSIFNFWLPSRHHSKVCDALAGRVRMVLGDDMIWHDCVSTWFLPQNLSSLASGKKLSTGVFRQETYQPPCAAPFWTPILAHACNILPKRLYINEEPVGNEAAAFIHALGTPQKARDITRAIKEILTLSCSGEVFDTLCDRFWYQIALWWYLFGWVPTCLATWLRVKDHGPLAAMCGSQQCVWISELYAFCAMVWYAERDIETTLCLSSSCCAIFRTGTFRYRCYGFDTDVMADACWIYMCLKADIEKELVCHISKTRKNIYTLYMLQRLVPINSSTSSSLYAKTCECTYAYLACLCLISNVVSSDSLRF